MKELRELIKTRFNQISDIEFGDLISDDAVQMGITYFGYLLQVDYENWDLDEHGDFDKNYPLKVTLVGNLMRKKSTGEDTLGILDDALSEIKEALKDLNFKYSYADLFMENDIRKIQVIGTVKYSEINNQLIV